MKETLVLKQKKNNMNAKNAYQYSKIEHARFYFVPCTMEETYDELVFTYNIAGLLSFDTAKAMRNAEKYGFLLQILEAIEASSEYQFSLHPNNLYLDSQRRIRILERDVRNQMGTAKIDWLRDIQALGGYLFQKRYRYESLREGGASLLKKSSKTKYLLALDGLEKARELFQTLQEEAAQKDQKELICVKKAGYYRRMWIMGLAVTGCLTLAVVFVYQNYRVIPLQASALMAERYYMEKDFPAVADALANISLADMDRHEKYLLASVYIRGQSVDSFQTETKERLLSKLSYNGDEQILDYWISLGRMDVDQALDIAMRMSDHQLTLYAYLQKIDQVAVDRSLSGAEKVEQMNTLRGKVKTLADELGIEYKEQ